MLTATYIVAFGRDVVARAERLALVVRAEQSMISADDGTPREYTVARDEYDAARAALQPGDLDTAARAAAEGGET